MSITSGERLHIEQVVEPQSLQEKDFKTLLPEPVFDFIKRKNRFGTIRDRILFVEKNRYRFYDAITVTKFLNDQLDIPSLIEQILSNMTPPYLTFIDFHFVCDAQPTEDDLSPFKLQTGSKASAMNDIVKVSSSNDFDKLMSQFRDATYSDLLNSVFIHHYEMYDFSNSGLRPNQLLSLVLHVQKFPSG